MIALLFAAVAMPHATHQSALSHCRPILARKAGGEIATISVGSRRTTARGETITGSLTAFLGMAPPPPGSASTHHLIRADFTFRCTVRRGVVRSASVESAR